MLAHFTRMAVNALLRFKMHSLIGLISLVFGFFCFIAATLLANYVDSFEEKFPNSENIYNIVQVGLTDDAPFERWPIVNEPAARYLRATFPEIEHIARTTMSSNSDITYEGLTESFAVRYVEAEFFEIFPVTLSTTNSMTDRSSLPPNSALITETAAMTRFGTIDVVGRVLTIANQLDVNIAGVISSIDFPTHLNSPIPMFKAELFISIEAFDTLDGNAEAAQKLDPATDHWGNQSYFVFLQFPEGEIVDVENFNQRLGKFVTTYIPPDWSEYMTYEMEPVNKLTTSMFSILTQGFNLVNVLQVAGALVLLIGCLNYSNLVIAQLSLRSQEIAVQKILGAKRSLLILQYCYESFFFVAISLAITLLVFALLLTQLGEAVPGVGPGMLLSPSLWSVLLAVVALIVMIAGFYPAVRTATVRLVTMMRPKGSGGYSGRMRSIMVGTQFFISGTLMILAIVMFRQNVTMTQQLDGEIADPKIVVTVPLDTIDVETELLMNQLKSHPAVLSITQVDRQPWEMGMNTISISLEPDVNATTVEVGNHNVGYDFAETLDIPLLAGRMFSRDRANDVLPPPEELVSRGGPYGLIVDDISARGLGFADADAAIGQTVYRHLDPPDVPNEIVVAHTIVGAVGKQKFQFIDFNTFGISGDVYTLRPENANIMIIRVSRTNLNETLLHIDNTWRDLMPDTPIKRVFADELFYDTYSLFLAIASAIGGLSMFGFFIASIGLLGNATFITNVRQKEVGIRKVMGASSNRLLGMLLLDFAKPVIIANALAWPLGYVIASGYISLFAVRTDIGLMPFLVSFSLSVLIAVGAVVSQSWKSARVRPALTLRYE
ncbi:MAG: ABC transporter permease [Gammaproteobacteria bacterium]|nr:ABC transporter permease [Gammaproteobacteria bacterium]